MVALVGPPGTGITVAGVSLTVLILCLVMTAVVRSVGGTMAASPEAVQQARDARRLGLARIDSLRQTGTQVNDQPLCELGLTVQPLSGSAFATTMRTIVPLTAIPAFQPRTEHEVAILLEGGPEVAFVDDALSPDERARLRVPARSSVPVVEVTPYTRVVGGRRKGPWLGVGRQGRPLRLLAYAVVAVAAAAVVVVPYREGLAQTVEAIQDGRLHADLRRPDVLAQAQQALEREIGHDAVVSVYVGADLVIAEAPLTPGDTRTDRWTYRGGRVSHDGPASIQPELAEEQLAWCDVAFDQVWPLMESAAEQVGLPVGDASAYVVRSVDSSVDSPTFGRSVGPATISFSIGDDYGSTSFRYAADGSELED